MSPFLEDYLIFVFWASLGAIQIGASVGRLEGMLFVRHHLAARLLGAALIVSAIVWFFLSEERNINDIHGGLDAGSQSMGFFAGGALATIATLVVSSLINMRMRTGEPGSTEGLGALAKATYFETLRRSVTTWMDGSPSRLLEFYLGDRPGPLFALGGRMTVWIRGRVGAVRR